MLRPIAIETTSVEMWNHLLTLEIEGVSVSRIIRLSEDSKVKLMVAFASGVAINLFSAALYDALKNFHPNETTIDGKQVTTNEVQIGVLINSQVQINQSSTKADCKPNPPKGSRGSTP